MRLRLVVTDAARALARTAVPSLVATLTVVIAASGLSLFVPVVRATSAPPNEPPVRLAFDVYLRNGTAPIEREKLRQELVMTPNVKRVEFISMERALAGARTRSPNAFPPPGPVPRLDLLRVTPADPNRAREMEDRLVGRGAGGRRTRRPAAIEGVRRHEKRPNRAVSVTRMVVLLVVALGTPLLLGTMVVVANSVHLSVLARRREVELMRLVGATAWFIRCPFVLQGLLMGVAGGGLAVVIFAVVQATLIDDLFGLVALIPARERVELGVLAAVLPAACAAASALGSGLTVRRLVRV